MYFICNLQNLHVLPAGISPDYGEFGDKKPWNKLFQESITTNSIDHLKINSIHMKASLTETESQPENENWGCRTAAGARTGAEVGAGAGAGKAANQSARTASGLNESQSVCGAHTDWQWSQP